MSHADIREGWAVAGGSGAIIPTPTQLWRPNNFGGLL
jgi:hypothetical protein